MNSGFLISDAGLAAATIATPEGPFVHITGFKVGSAYGYAAEREMTDIQGTLLYTGQASGYTIIDGNTVEVLLVMPADVGPFVFGEIGLFLESGELFALTVFDNPQEKIRAVGPQAGATWKLRARILLAQAPVIVQVDLINSNSILEVPNWQSLQKPVDQVMNANIAIVHANNSSGDPVLVIRDTDNEWGLVDYTRVLNGNTADVGAVLEVNQFTHPGLASLYLEGMPRTDSKYLIKFPDGSIRRITDQPDPTVVTFAPNVVVSSGSIKVWEEGGGTPRINWADTPEYNKYVTDFNPYWSTPRGPYRDGVNNAPYPASNKGKGQTPLATLTRRTNTLDWVKLMTAVRANCQIHNISLTDIADITDFVYRPVGPLFPSLHTLREQYLALVAKLTAFETNRNVFNTTLQDQVLATTNSQNVFWSGTKTFRSTFTYDNVVQAQLNSGHEFRFTGRVEDVTNGDWYELRDLLTTMNQLFIRHDQVYTTGGGVTTGVGLQELTFVAQTIWHMTANNWVVTLQAYRPAATFNQIVFDVLVNNSGTSPYVGPSPPGNIIFDFYSRRASSTLLNTPVLPHPTAVNTIV